MADQMWTAGSVTVTNGSATVSGSGTGWQTAGVAGGLFMQAGVAEGIASVESETSLTLAQPWAGPTATGDYSILRSTSDAAGVIDLYDRLSKALVTLSLAGIHPNAAGTLTKRDALTLGVDDDGFLFLHAEIGVAFVYYLWDGTDWQGPFPVAAPGTPGASGVLNWITAGWASGEDYEINDGLSHLGSSYRCYVDHTAASLTEPGVGADWETVWQVTAAKGEQGEPGADGADGLDGTGTGDVVGPSSSTDGHVALFDGTTGKLLKSAGVLFSSLASVTYVDGLFTALRNGVSASFDTLSEIATELGLKMAKSANLSDVADAATAFNNIKQASTALSSGVVTIGNEIREKLSANRTYYVRTNGSNSNNGLANTAGGAFLTLQKAWDVILTLDLNGFDVTIQVADGTYTAGITTTKPPIGGNVSLIGNAGTPANVIISTTNVDALSFEGPMRVSLQGFEIRTTTGGFGISAKASARVLLDGAMRFGACAYGQIGAFFNASVAINANYTISGSAEAHWRAEDGGMIDCKGKTITLSGTPAFSTAFCVLYSQGRCTPQSNTYSGSATGKRYDINQLSLLHTNGAGATALPGNASGTSGTGATYV